jgi:hypothetical protein
MRSAVPTIQKFTAAVGRVPAGRSGHLTGVRDAGRAGPGDALGERGTAIAAAALAEAFTDTILAAELVGIRAGPEAGAPALVRLSAGGIGADRRTTGAIGTDIPGDRARGIQTDASAAVVVAAHRGVTVRHTAGAVDTGRPLEAALPCALLVEAGALT